MKLVPNWRKLHRMWSVQLAVLAAVAQGIWAALPALQGYVSPVRMIALSCGCSLLILAARLTHQPGISDDDA